tara:strand:+ start:48 stop:1967 length:1920 start_codon:yes stop_codon:yes gene_type:complete
MAYSKVNNTSGTNKKDIKYLNRNYNSLKQDLVNFTKNYFPDNFNDFSESNPGMIFLELASYVGDVLSFYTDTQVQETFIESAREKTNLLSLAYNLGYKPSVTSPSTTDIDLYIQIPSTGTGTYPPDWNYAISINKNSTFKSGQANPTTFLLDRDVNFKFSSSLDPTEVSIYDLNGNPLTTAAGGNAEYYLLKKSAKVISAQIKSTTFTLNEPIKFLTLEIPDTKIIGIESIVDSDGNKYHEVPYLAQETMYEEVLNVGANNPNLDQYGHDTPYLLRLKKVPKRFVTRFTSNNILQIQFGAGVSSGIDEEIIPNPDNIGIGVKDNRSLLDFAFDPSNFMLTKTYGEVPSNTTLTVNYLVGGGVESNVDSNLITVPSSVLTSQNNSVGNEASLSTVIESIASNNPLPATGGGPGDTIEDIRLNAIANAGAQLRTVSKEDYIIRTLSLPSKFGKIAKAYIIKDDQITVDTNARISNPNGLDLYTLAYDGNKNLTNLNPATRQNLITYLEEYRMLTDAVNIKDAFVINFGVEFEIIAFKNSNNEQVLLKCINSLEEYFNIDHWQINQPIALNEIYNVIGSVEGVQNVENVRLYNKAGTALGYSQYAYDFDSANVDNIIYPSMDLSIFELKYPKADITGRITKY